MTPEPGAGLWADAIRVAALLAAYPQACVGIRLRAGAGPVRDAWLRHLTDRLATGTAVRRCPPGIGDDRLLGGLDLAATLSAGRPVAQAGLLAEADGGLVVVPMAERLSPGTAARLAAALDTGTVAVARDGFFETRSARFGLVLLDEGLDDEAPPVALTERLAFDVDLRDLGLRDIDGATASDPARRTPDRAMEPDDASEAVAALCATAEALGVASLRGPLLAVRIARLIAACDGRSVLAEPDLAEAARLVLGPRATRMPAPEQPGDDTEPPPPQASPDDERPPDTSADEATSEPQQAEPPSLDDVVLAAALAAIPPGLLAALAAGQAPARGGKAGKAGAAAAAARQGRPIGARAGDPRRGRLALLATCEPPHPGRHFGGRKPEGARRGRSSCGRRTSGSRATASGPRAPRSSRSTPPARRRSSGSPRRRGRSSYCWPRPTSGATGSPSSPSAGGRRSSCCRRRGRWCGPSAGSPGCPAAAARLWLRGSTRRPTWRSPSAVGAAPRSSCCSPMGAPTSTAPGLRAGRAPPRTRARPPCGSARQVTPRSSSTPRRAPRIRRAAGGGDGRPLSPVATGRRPQAQCRGTCRGRGGVTARVGKLGER